MTTETPRTAEVVDLAQEPELRAHLERLDTADSYVETYFQTLQEPAPLKPVIFRWEEVEPLLEALNASQLEESLRAGKIINFVSKGTGELHGTTPVMLAGFQIIAPRYRGLAHQHTNTAIQYCVQGHGYSVIDGVRYEWRTGDVIVFPAGCVHEHANLDDEQPAIFFHVHDLTLVRAMRLKTTTNYPDGCQPVVGEA